MSDSEFDMSEPDFKIEGFHFNQRCSSPFFKDQSKKKSEDLALVPDASPEDENVESDASPTEVPKGVHVLTAETKDVNPQKPLVEKVTVEKRFGERNTVFSRNIVKESSSVRIDPPGFVSVPQEFQSSKKRKKNERTPDPESTKQEEPEKKLLSWAKNVKKIAQQSRKLKLPPVTFSEPSDPVLETTKETKKVTEKKTIVPKQQNSSESSTCRQLSGGVLVGFFIGYFSIILLEVFKHVC